MDRRPRVGSLYRMTDATFNHVVSALSGLSRARTRDAAEPKEEHLPLLQIDDWADGGRQPPFLDDQLAGPWKEHYQRCAKCQKMIAFYRAEATDRAELKRRLASG